MDGERGEERGEEEDGGSSTFSQESEGKSSEKVRENHKKNPFSGVLLSQVGGIRGRWEDVNLLVKWKKGFQEFCKR